MRLASILPVMLALRLAAQSPGSLDATFNSGDEGYALGDGASGDVWSMNVRPDGRIFMGGEFATYDALSAPRVTQLQSDGRRDASFASGIGASAATYCSLLQPDGRIIIGGAFTSFNGATRGRIARMMPDGSLDAGFATGTGASTFVQSMALLGDGRIMIGGSFTSYDGTARSRIARLNSNGSLDLTFDPGSGANGSVLAIALQPDGKILIGGGFSSYNGAAHNRLARLNADGSVDATFNPGTNGTVYAIALQPDGKILIGGVFILVNGVGRNYLARLNADGSLDTSFNTTGAGANAQVNTIALQTDGKVLLGGPFTSYRGSPMRRMARANSDGTADATFVTGLGAEDQVRCIALQADGKVLIGGSLISYQGAGPKRIARLNSDGSRDVSFAPGNGANDIVNDVELQPDGRILIGGDFTSFNGVGRNCIARLLPDGIVDPSFDPGTGATTTGTGVPHVDRIVVQPDGKILIGGYFNEFNGIARNSIARLNSDGSLDATFNPGSGADGSVYTMAVQSDGKIVVGGWFDFFNGGAVGNMIRLTSTGAVDASFNTGTGTTGMISSTIRSMLLQADGKVVIAGGFIAYNGTSRNGIARLNTDGSLDGTFNPGTGIDIGVIHNVLLQPDGKLLIDGSFVEYNGTPRYNIARVLSNGSVDTSFDPGTATNPLIHGAGLQPDGRIIIVGQFTSYNGVPRPHIARLQPDGALDLTFDAGSGPAGGASEVAIQPDGRALIAGWSTSYDGTGRNRIARVHGGDACLVAARAVLDGPYVSGAGLMSDALRGSGLLPMTEPYSAIGYLPTGASSATIPPSVLAVTGNNAIVDWVFIEARNAITPANVVAARPVLLQRDGDLVALDGVSPVALPMIPGNYFIALRHRNHLGVMTAASFTLSAIPTTIDFTLTGAATYGTNAQKPVGSKMALWAGDANGDGVLKYAGGNNDRDLILQAIGGSVPTSTLSNVYDRRDVTLNGAVSYAGAGNDRDIILVNIGGSVPTNTRMQQLP